jgi:hypothetical protein
MDGQGDGQLLGVYQECEPGTTSQTLELVDKFRSTLDEFLHVKISLWHGVSTVEVVEVPDCDPKDVRRRLLSISLKRGI